LLPAWLGVGFACGCRAAAAVVISAALPVCIAAPGGGVVMVTVVMIAVVRRSGRGGFLRLGFETRDFTVRFFDVLVRGQTRIESEPKKENPR
jgi:hypothetical protein